MQHSLRGVRSMLRIKELHDRVEIQAAETRVVETECSSKRVAEQLVQIERVSRL